MITTNNEREIASIRKILGSHPHIRLAILFGSMAAGSASAQSDIDLAVDTGRPLEAARKIQLISDLAEALGRPVDLVDLHCAGEPLLGQIIGGGVRLLGSDRHYASMLSKHLFDQADFMPYRSRILKERRQAWIGP
jgi:uncharacterized protein